MDKERIGLVPPEAAAFTSEKPAIISEPAALNPNGATVFEGPQKPFDLQAALVDIAAAWDEGYYDHHKVR